MCGIAGFVQIGGAGALTPNESLATAMATAIAHRGPDDQGAWSDPAAGVYLAHRRLAVLDLSTAGHQPMASASGRYIIVFNGEIYNHLELRAELPAVAWRGQSDTETLLELIDERGIAATLPRMVGMFAMALWDRRERILYLARDRLGEKPLYYGWQGNSFLFGSELKALRAHPAFGAQIDRGAVALYVRRNYVPAPYTIYRGIHKLLPGTYLAVHVDRHEAVPTVYWSARDAAERGMRDPFVGDDGAARDELERLLNQAIAGQMLADVPLGAFLSGGIDSTTVVALMQAQASQPVRTFTIGFTERDYNEAEQAKAIAQHLGTDHTELYVTPAQAQEVIPGLPALYDEPFADSSQIPMLLVSKLARSRVTVCVSGDGGDEMFGGYNRHLWGPRVSRTSRIIPRPVRTLAARVCRTLSSDAWDRSLQKIAPLLPPALRHRQPADKLRKLAAAIDPRTSEELYLQLISQGQDPARVLRDAVEPAAFGHDLSIAAFPDLASRMMLLDAIGYLPDDILVKVDRAAMSVSLETRVPMLDHRVVEFAWRLPLSMKIRNGTGKWLLRQVLARHVPTTLFDRPKSGFALPLHAWLRGPLREWVEALIDESRLRGEGFFDATAIGETWREHLSGRRNHASAMWNVLMFQSWFAATSGSGRVDRA
jgi:asparagine synthase (glutamine-hydrolysing)